MTTPAPEPVRPWEGWPHRLVINGEITGGRLCLDWKFDEAPFYLEIEYAEGGDLGDWAAEQGGLESVPLDDVAPPTCSNVTPTLPVDVASDEESVTLPVCPAVNVK